MTDHAQARSVALTQSGQSHFEEPEAFAAAIPGGDFGAIPLRQDGFRATVWRNDLGAGVSVRGVGASNALVLRSEFRDATRPTMAFVLPVLAGTRAWLDGKEVGARSIATRVAGDTPHLRTFGAHEAGAITVDQEVLREAAAVLLGCECLAPLVWPATVVELDPRYGERITAVHRAAGEVLARFGAEIGTPGLHLLRDRVLAVLVTAMGGDRFKSDHKARQAQTASMARIERYIDEHRESAIGLQDLCRGTGLALRTVETIVRSRTGLPALAYLHRRRLAYARVALLNPVASTCVTEVAMRFGFLHLGRFAGAYRQNYGESPSQTLARVEGRRG